MGQFPPREPPPKRHPRRELPRPERPFDRLLRRRPERDPAPIIIGGTVAFLVVVIVFVILISSVLGGNGDGGNGETIDIAPGIRGRLAQIPALPPGLEAASRYIEFELEDENSPAVIGLPLNEQTDEASNLAFYTYVSGRWQRQLAVTLEEEGRVAQGDFPSVPGNLAVLRVVSQTYLAAASLPSGSTLHPDASVNIVNPRDFAPASDGSIAGEGTPVQVPDGVEIIPTIVGSGAENSDIVDSIIGSEELQATHIEAITELVADGEYAGIDLEYAEVSNVLEDEFTIFVRALSEELHATGAKLSLTLPPPSNQASAYDWSELGDAADYIRILPLANPVRYWEIMPESLNQLVEDVDPRKVLLVLNPFSVETIGEVARPIGYLQAMVLAGEIAVREPANPEEIQAESDVVIAAANLDPGGGASPLAWSDDAAAVTFTSGGTEPRTVYIENSYSIGFKLELVQAYGFLGAAVSDGSAQSDTPHVWPTVNELTQSSTVTLARPNESALLPSWEAQEGDLGAAAGTAVTWIAPENPGSYTIRLIISDGVLRFARETAIEVGEPDEPDGEATPVVTLPPDETPTPTPEPTPTATPTPTPPPSDVAVEVGLRADGDDSDEGQSELQQYTDEEVVPPNSQVSYRVVIDNDSDESVSVISVIDNDGEVPECTTEPGGGGESVFDVTLEPDDGDADLGNDVLNGGDDEVVCFYTRPAPPSTRSTTVTATVRTADGATGTNDDSTLITVSEE